MFSNLFRKLVDLSPKLSLTIWKYFYEFTALLFRKMSGWKFMNYGFASIENSSGDYNTLSANMYQHLLDQAKIEKGSYALEVGSGRGGGCELLLKYDPELVTGIDFSKNALFTGFALVVQIVCVCKHCCFSTRHDDAFLCASLIVYSIAWISHVQTCFSQNDFSKIGLRL
jgi:predicted rRNA methylase YqxC with S4 and FtsJ domains